MTSLNSLRLSARKFLVLIMIGIPFALSAQANEDEIETRPPHADAIKYAFIHSDSLLIQPGKLYKEVHGIIGKGTKTSDESTMPGTIGPCTQSIRKYKTPLTSLIVIKGDCEAGGFENHQFISHGDSLKVYRKFKVDGTNNRINISEDIYEFKGRRVVHSRRYSDVKDWKHPDLWKHAFKVSTTEGGYNYNKFKGWMEGYKKN